MVIVPKCHSFVHRTRERVKSLQAEVNVLTMAMSDTRDHVAMYQKERDEAMQRESVLLEKVEHMNAIISKAQKEVYDAKHNLAAQKRVNEALMKKKVKGVKLENKSIDYSTKSSRMQVQVF